MGQMVVALSTFLENKYFNDLSFRKSNMANQLVGILAREYRWVREANFIKYNIILDFFPLLSLCLHSINKNNIRKMNNLTILYKFYRHKETLVTLADSL